MNFSRVSGIGSKGGTSAAAEEARKAREQRATEREKRQYAVRVFRLLWRWHCVVRCCKEALAHLDAASPSLMVLKSVTSAESSIGTVVAAFQRCVSSLSYVVGHSPGDAYRKLVAMSVCQRMPSGQAAAVGPQGVAGPFLTWVKDAQTSLLPLRPTSSRPPAVAPKSLWLQLLFGSKEAFAPRQGRKCSPQLGAVKSVAVARHAAAIPLPFHHLFGMLLVSLVKLQLGSPQLPGTLNSTKPVAPPGVTSSSSNPAGTVKAKPPEDTLRLQGTKMLALQLLFHHSTMTKYVPSAMTEEAEKNVIQSQVSVELLAPTLRLPGLGETFFLMLALVIRGIPPTPAVNATISSPAPVIVKTLLASAFQFAEIGCTGQPSTSGLPPGSPTQTVAVSQQQAAILRPFSRYVLAIPRLLDTLLISRGPSFVEQLLSFLGASWLEIFSEGAAASASSPLSLLRCDAPTLGFWALGNVVSLGLKRLASATKDPATSDATGPAAQQQTLQTERETQLWLGVISIAFGYSKSVTTSASPRTAGQATAVAAVPTIVLSNLLTAIERDSREAATFGAGGAPLGDQIKGLWSAEGFPVVFGSLLTASEAAKKKRDGEANAKPLGFFASMRAKAKEKEENSIERQRLKALAQDAVFVAPPWLPVAHLMLRSMTMTSGSSGSSSSIALSLLSRAPETLPPLWDYCELFLPRLVNTLQALRPLMALQPGGAPDSRPADRLPIPPPAVLLTAYVALSLFAQLFSLFLTVLDDHEFVTLQVPFSLQTTIRSIVQWTNKIIVAGAFAQLPPPVDFPVGPTTPEGREALLQVLDTIVRDDLRLRGYLRSTLRLLIDRNNRTPWIAPGEETIYWLPDNVVDGRLFPNGGQTVPSGPALRLLFEAPHLAPFPFRVRYLQQFITADRSRHSADKVKYAVKVRRTHCLADGYDQIMKISSSDVGVLRARLHVTFVDTFGQAEAGIDAGGVFKEFMEVLIKEAFNPQFGLFRTAEGSNELFPNAHSVHLFSSPSECYEHYRFLGRVLGKAMYEGAVVPLYFAPFFLNNLLGRGNTLDDLRRFDPDQYRSLMQLKDLANVEDACIYFAIEEQFLGQTVVTDLIPNGREVPVTNENVVRYLHMCAHHRLYVSTQPHTAAFVSGLFDVLDKSWIALFNAAEIQQLISGSKLANQKLNVAELKENTKLVGGYTMDSRTINILFEVLDELSPADQALFLQFVTGSSRPPLLGFGAMNPPFSIRRTEEGSNINYVVDIDRLPTAATCFNLLKLPPYKSKSNLKEKLLTAIRSNSGFDLS